MTAPDRGVPTTDEGSAYTTSTVSSIQGITEASAFSVMNANVMQAFGVFGSNSSNSLASTAASVGSTAWGQAISGVANTALGNTSTISSGISGSTNPAAVSGTVNNIQDNVAANASAIAGLTTKVNGTGTTVSQTFIAGNGIGADWTTGAQGTPGLWKTTNAGATIATSGNNGYRWAVNTTVMTTDNHSVTAVAGGDAGGTEAATTLIIRAAANLSTFVYANCFQESQYIGHGTFLSGTFTFNDWASTGSYNILSGNTVVFQANADVYTLTLNGTPILTYTDTGSTATVGSNNRSIGMSMQEIATIFVDYVAWPISSINATDL